MSRATTSTPTTQGNQIPHDKIATRAYEKWCKRGQPQGSQQQDWLEAEAELRAEMARGGSATGTQRR
jgi:hypothetical protein